MADLIVRNATLFANQESSEGTAAAGVAGDAILASGIAVEFGLEMNQREYQGTPGIRAPVAGTKVGSGISFATELKGNGTTTLPEVDELLTAVFGQVTAADLDSTISGAAGSATIWDVTSVANGTVGNLVMLETSTADTYEVGGIITAADTGATPDDLTVSPGAINGGYATNGKKVKEMRTWAPLLPPASVNSVTFDLYHNADAGAGQFDRLTGARGTFSVSSPKAGAIPMFSWKFTGWAWAVSTSGTRPTPSYDTASPKAAQSVGFRVDGTATNAYDIELDVGAVVSQKLSQNSTDGVYGCPHTAYKPSGSFKIHPAHTSVAEFTALTAGTQRSLLFQCGNTLYGTWAWFVPKAVVTKVSRVDDSGVGALQVDWVAIDQDDALATACDASIYFGVG